MIRICKFIIISTFIFLIGMFGYKLFFPEIIKFPQQLIDMFVFVSMISFLIVFYYETTNKKEDKEKRD